MLQPFTVPSRGQLSGGRAFALPALLLHALASCLLSSTSVAASGPDWGDWGQPQQVAFWCLVFIATPFAVISLAVFVFGLLGLQGVVGPPPCCGGRTYHWANLALLFIWPFPLALSIYLITQGLRVAAVYLGWAILAMLLHGLLLFLFIKQARRNAQDHPRQQLLTAQKYSDKNAVPDTATATRDADRDVAASGAAAAAMAALAAQPLNPFQATYGLLPGTSQYGYQIFIPADPPEPHAGGAGTPAAKESSRTHRHNRAYDLDQTRTRPARP